MLVGLLMVVGCGGDRLSSPPSTTIPNPTTAIEPESTPSPVVPEDQRSAAVASFPDAASVESWRNVDDSVMGGVSVSTSTWIRRGADGAMEFSGELSTDNNGGFASVLSRVDRGYGVRAAGSRALGVRAVGDGRTYLLQLRAGPSGTDRWISRFTPPTADTGGAGPTVELPLSSFEPVNQFLRPVDPIAALDPAEISQIGVYVLDGQVGSFRLVLQSISPVR